MIEGLDRIFRLLFAGLTAGAMTTTLQLAAATEGGGDLRAATQNPISSMYSLPFKFTFDNGADNGDANFLNIQPVLPATVGDWNLVNRIIIPVADSPGGITGLPSNPGVGDATKTGRTSGLGDINYSLFFNPLETKGDLIWGLGGSITAPTASDDRLGSGKWSAGPTWVWCNPSGAPTACWCATFGLSRVMTTGGTLTRR